MTSAAGHYRSAYITRKAVLAVTARVLCIGASDARCKTASGEGEIVASLKNAILVAVLTQAWRTRSGASSSMAEEGFSAQV